NESLAHVAPPRLRPHNVTKLVLNPKGGSQWICPRRRSSSSGAAIASAGSSPRRSSPRAKRRSTRTRNSGPTRRWTSWSSSSPTRFHFCKAAGSGGGPARESRGHPPCFARQAEPDPGENHRRAEDHRRIERLAVEKRADD